ncbi:hypothetical protein VTK56DRAFT_3057 [Thermocarpiscus australiensis]
MAATQFPLFERLPRELQLMVWEETIEPRIVEVNLVFKARPRRGQPKLQWVLTRPPALLAVSRHARWFAQRQYQVLCLGYPHPVPSANPTPPPPPPQAITYFHPRLDVLSQNWLAIAYKEQDPVVCQPRTKWNAALKGGFYCILPPPERPLNWSIFDVAALRHIHINLHVVKNSSRNYNRKGLFTEAPTFINGLLSRGPDHHPGIDTCTIRVTVDDTLPPAAPPAHLSPLVYRIVRVGRNSAYGPAPAVCFDTHYGAFALGTRQITPVLRADGAVFVRPLVGRHATEYAVLRVLDVDSTVASGISAIDNRNNHNHNHDNNNNDDNARPDRLRAGSPGMLEEVLLFAALDEAWRSTGPRRWAQWLTDAVADLFPVETGITPWGVCGVNYGMGEARAYRAFPG